jgi:hypothetical protein
MTQAVIMMASLGPAGPGQYYLYDTAWQVRTAEPCLQVAKLGRPADRTRRERLGHRAQTMNNLNVTTVSK